MTDANPAFEPVFQRLRGILEPYGQAMYVSADDESNFAVDQAPPGQRKPSTWFGAVRKGKSYVSIYLMPVYVDPSLMDDASPELRRRMQGKSCFNFRSVDERLFAELEELLRRGQARAA